MAGFKTRMIFGFFVSLFVVSPALCQEDKSQEEAEEEAITESSSSEKSAPDTDSTKANTHPLSDFKAELEIGRMMAGRLIAFYGMHEDTKLKEYLNQVGRYVANSSQFADRKLMVAVLDSESVNAFACPGGYVFVTKGLLKIAENEAEIAAVLGHEIAHVGLQHMFKTLRTMSAEEAAKLSAETAKLKSNDEYGFSRRRPEPSVDGIGAAVAKFFVTASGSGLSVLAAAKAAMNVLLEKGLDHSFELDADKHGVKYAINAGYDPKAISNLLSRIYKTKKADAQSKAPTVSNTHPTLKERQEVIKAQWSEMKADQITGAVLASRYESFKVRVTKKLKQQETAK